MDSVLVLIASNLEMASTDPKKPLSLKQKATRSKANEEPIAKKVDNHLLLDITTEEHEKFMEGECPKNTTKSNE